MKRLFDIVIILLLLVLIYAGRGIKPGANADSTPNDTDSVDTAHAVSLDEAKKLFSEASKVSGTENGVYEISNADGILGFAVKSSPYSDRIVGFMGPTPLLIALGTDGRVLKVEALENSESRSYFDSVINSGLLGKWNGLTPQEAAEKQVDAVSGATYSSRSVIDSMRARMSALGNVEIRNAGYDWVDILRSAAMIVLVLVTLVAYFKPSMIARWQLPVLVAAILVLGIWQGRMLSMAQFTTWVFSGIPIAAQWAILLIFLLSVTLPAIFGKAYYCAWLCPMGAAQTLIGRLNRKHKLKLGVKLVQWLALLRPAVLFGGLLVIGIGLSFDFADYEAFAVFHPQSAPIAALVIGILSLLLSVWIPRPWCRFLCPIGEMLELVRYKKADKENRI